MALIDNLISYWALDEGSGNAVDLHGSNDLTETSGTIGTASALPLGNARDFEAGDTEHFEIADNADLSTGDINWSCIAWVRAESLGANRVVAAKMSGNNTSSEWRLYYRTSGGTDRFRLEKISGSTNVAVNFSATIPAINTNYFLAWGHSASADEIWISLNAQTPETFSTSTGVNNGTVPFQVGFGTGIDYWDGLIGHLAFFKRDIRSDLASFYNSGSGLAYPFGGGTDVVVTLPALDCETEVVAPVVSTAVAVLLPTAICETAIVAPTIVVGNRVELASLSSGTNLVAPTVALGGIVAPQVLSTATELLAPSVSVGSIVVVPVLDTTTAVLSPLVQAALAVVLSPLEARTSVIAPRINGGGRVAGWKRLAARFAIEDGREVQMGGSGPTGASGWRRLAVRNAVEAGYEVQLR